MSAPIPQIKVSFELIERAMADAKALVESLQKLGKHLVGVSQMTPYPLTEGELHSASAAGRILGLCQITETAVCLFHNELADGVRDAFATGRVAQRVNIPEPQGGPKQ